MYADPAGRAGILAAMRVGVLRGRDHTGIGRVACLAEGALGLAISRGGATKRYAHRDPNEDAVGFAHGPGGVVLAIADGHGGHQASEQAVEELIALAADWTGPTQPPEPWEHAAARFVTRIHDAIRAAGASGGNPGARTTLSFASIRPLEDRWAWAAVGDSHVFRLAGDDAVECGAGDGAPRFLGSPAREGDELDLRLGHEPLPGMRGLVLVSDGLSERGIGVADPPGAVAEAVALGARHPLHLRPLESARTLVEIALDSHRRHDAGDNVACAIWLRG